MVLSGCVSSPTAATPSPNPLAISTPLSQTASQPTPAQAEPSAEVVGPGSLKKRTGEEISLSRETLLVFNLVTGEGILLLGLRQNVSNNFLRAVYENQKNYAAGGIVLEKDWVRVTPKPALKIALESEATTLVSGAGLVYGNTAGEMLLSISDTPPPKGFGVVGQAQIPQKCIDHWIQSKEPIKIENAYAGRDE